MKALKTIPVLLQCLILLPFLLSACDGGTPEASRPSPAPTSSSLPEDTAPAETPGVESTKSADMNETPAEPGEGTTELPAESGLEAVIVSGDSAGTGKPFTFDATQSQAGDAEIVSYVWNMGDGTTLFGNSVQHAYKEPGFYTVTLTVTDAEGNTDTTAKVVEVSDDLVEATPTTAAEFTLSGTSWGLTNAMRGTTVTLVFGDEDLSGSAGCNTYSAAYTITKVEEGLYDVTVTGITTSNQVCTQEIMAQEHGYLESLASASRITVEGDTLTLETGSGTLTFSLLTA